jgi:hypothetical protein
LSLSILNKKASQEAFFIPCPKKRKREWESRTRESPKATAVSDEAGLALTEPRVDRLSLSILKEKSLARGFFYSLSKKRKREWESRTRESPKATAVSDTMPNTGC